MAILSSTGIAGFLSSAKATGKQILNKAGKLVPEFIEYFAPGFAGHGWKIWERDSGVWRMETDELVIRRTMIVFELLISKIRCIKGALNISQANGKIKTAELKNGNWYITIEDEMSFVPHDIIRCQHFSNGTKFYWVEIDDIIENNSVLVIPATEFTGSLGYKDGIERVVETGSMSVPEPGDEIIQFGNSKNTDRQSAIYLHADEGGQPAIDILFGIKTKSFDGCLKQRMGGSIPGGEGAKGFYCENGMIKGTDDTGHTVYCIHPDGSAEFGDGSAEFNKDQSGQIAGGAIAWQWSDEKQKYVCTMKGVVLTWENLDEEAKKNLKGDTGLQGVPGTPGQDGKIYYTWIRYADTAEGEGIGNSPVGKIYMGLAYNKESATESDNPSDYTWSRFRGEDGTAGVAGMPGQDGKTNYTWIAYSDYPDGRNMYQIPNDNTKYVGIAVNKETATESNVPSEYIWSKFKGENAIVYSIEFEHDGKVIQTIPAFADGVPKNYIGVTAKLYRIVGADKGLCSDYYFSLICTNADGKKYATCDFTPSSETFFTTFEGPVSYTISVSPEFSPYPTDIICSSTINIVCDGQQGEDAEVPDWVKDWTSNATEIGDKYVVSPQMFSGTSSMDVQGNQLLTGIIQGSDCITIDSVKRSGIFALVDNEVMFKLDPISKEYLFKGRVEATEGVFNGTINATDGVFNGFVKKKPTIITNDNLLDYIYTEIVEDYFLNFLDFNKTGTFIIFRGAFLETLTMYIPGIDPEILTYSPQEKELVRSLVGTTMLIYNYSDIGFGFTGSFSKESEPSSFSSIGLDPGEFLKLECICSDAKNYSKVSARGYEMIHWKYAKGLIR